MNQTATTKPHQQLRPMIHLVYLVHREALSSVFSSQVLTPLEHHRNLAKVSLILFTPIGHLIRPQYRSSLQAIQERCRHSDIQVHWIPSPPSRTPWLWSNTYLLRMLLLRKFDRNEQVVVRCRNSLTTQFALDATFDFANMRIIYDCRNAEILEAKQLLGLENIPESEWTSRAKKSFASVPKREYRAVTQTAGVTCISHAMVEMFRTRYPQIPVHKYRLAPCCPEVDTFARASRQRNDLRAQLSLQDKFVVSYLGSLAWYQQPEQSIRAYKIIRSIKANAHFLAITTEPDKMRRFAEQYDLSPSEVTILSLPPDDVPRWLSISDLGLSIRKSDETDQVSSPIKVGEYLAAGIPVIISPRQGDYSAVVKERNFGLVVDLSDPDSNTEASLTRFLSMTQEELAAMKSRCQAYARTELSWESLTPELVSWYHELLDQQPATDLADRSIETEVAQ